MPPPLASETPDFSPSNSSRILTFSRFVFRSVIYTTSNEVSLSFAGPSSPFVFFRRCSAQTPACVVPLLHFAQRPLQVEVVSVHFFFSLALGFAEYFFRFKNTSCCARAPFEPRPGVHREPFLVSDGQGFLPSPSVTMRFPTP